jgi:hemolysin activation/secretion protein
MLIVDRATRFRASLVVTALLCLVSAAQGQVPNSVDPGAAQQHSSETNQYYQLQDRIRRSREFAAPDPLSNHLATPPEPSDRSSERKTFFLKSIETNVSAILTQSQLAAITARYQGRQVNVDELNAMVAEINAFYKAHGYITAMAVLPPQRVTAGVVHIQLIEARLGKVVVKDNRHTRATYFTGRIPCQPGDLIQLDEIQHSLAYFNATNDVKVKAVLQPGQQFGTTDLVLDVQPTSAEATAFSADDTGLASTGRQRFGTTETIRSLLGYRDPLSLGAYWSNGMWAGFASYDIPLTASGLRLGPEVSYDSIRVRQSAVQKLGVNGAFYDVSLRLSRPVIASDHFSVTGYVAPHFQESTLQSQNYRISNIAARSLEFGTSLQAADNRGFWAANLFAASGDYNLLGLHAFLKFGGTATRVENFGKGVVAIFRAQGQGKGADPTLLPPSQQFQIGGLSTVRGYPEGALIGDSGYTSSAEVDAPVPFSSHRVFGIPLGQRIRCAAFVDHAALLSPHTTYLTGTGGGLILSLSRYLEGRVYLGTPLEERSQYNHVQIHFALQATPHLPAILQKFRKTRE